MLRERRNQTVHIMNINKTNYKNIWFGCLHVKKTGQMNELLGNVEGAYVNLLAKVHDKNEFLELINNYTKDLGLEFVELTNTSSLQSKYMRKEKLAKDLQNQIATLNEFGHVRFGTFHTY